MSGAIVENYISVNMASVMIGKTERTIIRWVETGKLQGEYRSGGTGKKLFISRASLIPYIPVASTPSPTTKQDATIEPVANGERQIIAGQNISRAEAERIIKQEDAIKKQRDNLVAEGKLVDKEKVGNALAEGIQIYYTSLLEMWEQIIDTWSIKLSLDATTSTEMLSDFHVALNTNFRKIRGKVEKAIDISSNN